MTHKIEISGVSKWFRRNGEEIAAMRETSLAIEEGRFVSIIGPSGCGKSTLFNIIAGLMPPSTGKVTADGKDIVGTTGYVGYMLQRTCFCLGAPSSTTSFWVWRSVAYPTTKPWEGAAPDGKIRSEGF